MKTLVLAVAIVAIVALLAIATAQRSGITAAQQCPGGSAKKCATYCQTRGESCCDRCQYCTQYDINDTEEGSYQYCMNQFSGE